MDPVSGAADLQRLGYALQFSVDGVLFTDSARTIVFASPSAQRLLGYAPAELLGRRLDDFVFPDDLAGMTALTPALRCRVRHADGRWRAIEGQAHNLLDDAAIGAVVIFFRDVTEQERIGDALRASEERYRRLVNGASDIIFQCDADGVFTFVNPTASAVMQFSQEDLLGHHFSELIRPDYRERIIALYLHQRDNRVSNTYAEFPAVAKDGAEVWIGQHVQIVMEDDRVVALQAVARDITERLRFEERLHQAQKLEAIGTLAGGIAHDFNNLLQTIRGNAELAVMRLKGGPRRELEDILDASDRAEKLVRHLLAFGQRQAMQPVSLSIADGIERVCRSWGPLLGERIELVTTCEPGVPAVRFDPAQFEQVLTNLILNARDAMPGGGRIEIAARRVQMTAALREQFGVTLADGAFVLLRVTDSGTGMTEDVQARIFEPFFTTKEQGKGTGLGLSSAYGIVTQSGGHVDVQSRVGEGSCFSVYLPAADAADAAEATARP